MLSVLARIYAIAINTFREAVRDRVLYGVLGFACAVLFFTLAIAELSVHEQARVVADVGLASISLFSVIVAMFLGSSLLYKEIERKTLYVILPKPVRRAEFLLGKYFGIFLTAFVFVALMGALQLWITAVQAGAKGALVGGALLALAALLGVSLFFARDRTAVLVPYSLIALVSCAFVAATTEAKVEPVLAQLFLCAIEVLVLAAVALLFSSFSTPFLTGAFTMGVWLLGRSADDMATMKSKQLAEPIRKLLHLMAEVLPNLQLYVPSRNLLSGEGKIGVWVYVGQATAYGLMYAALLLFMAALIFRRRDFI
jgi:ABC-type transport system involved in multi-copper enzyme maturation permease subunit